MAKLKKPKYRYVYSVVKRYITVSSVYEDEFFTVIFTLDHLDYYDADICAKKIAEKSCSSNYRVKATLQEVEEING